MIKTYIKNLKKRKQEDPLLLNLFEFLKIFHYLKKLKSEFSRKKKQLKLIAKDLTTQLKDVTKIIHCVADKIHPYTKNTSMKFKEHFSRLIATNKAIKSKMQDLKNTIRQQNFRGKKRKAENKKTSTRKKQKAAGTKKVAGKKRKSENEKTSRKKKAKS